MSFRFSPGGGLTSRVRSRIGPSRDGGRRHQARTVPGLEGLEARACPSAGALFQDTSDYLSTGPLPGLALAADVTGDGRTDVVTINGGDIDVVPGNGDATFQDRTITSPTGPGMSIFALGAGDFNGDGTLDLAAGIYSANSAFSAAVLFGNGDGTFQPATPYLGGKVPEGLAVADFNGDGKLDFATVNYDYVSNFTYSYTVLLNKGNGTFQSVTTPIDAHAVAIAAKDLDGDGRPDLVIADQSGGTYADGRVLVLLNRGDGTFQAPAAYPVVNGPAALALGDFNGDGTLDIATASALNAPVQDSSVLLGNGDGTFQAARSYGSDEDGVFTAADFNGDGKLDLAVGCLGAPYVEGGVEILLGNGDGTFRSARDYVNDVNLPGPVRVTGIAVADFNGDGTPDIAADNMVLLLGAGDGTFHGLRSPIAAGFGYEPIMAADVNDDGKPDLLEVSSANAYCLGILLSTGAGTFLPPRYISLAHTSLFAVADVNGDGKPDIVNADSTVLNTDEHRIRIIMNVATAEPNRSPVLTPVAAQTVDPGTELRLQIQATDPDPGQTLTYALGIQAPAGAAIDATTGVFTWTPTAEQAGHTDAIPLLVADDGTQPLTASEILSITVSATTTNTSDTTTTNDSDATTTTTTNTPRTTTTNTFTTAATFVGSNRLASSKKATAIRLTFSTPLDAAVAADVTRYRVTQPGRKKRSPSKVIPVRRTTYDPASDSVMLSVGQFNKRKPLTLIASGLRSADGSPVATIITML